MPVIDVWCKCPKCGYKLKMLQDTHYLFVRPKCPICRVKMEEIEREEGRFQEEGD